MTYISHKSNIIQSVHELEWECRKSVKGITTDKEYWAWLDSVTTDGVPDYSGETGYTIVECTDEDVQARLVQLVDYINHNRMPGEALVYNIKYYASKRDAEEIKHGEELKDEEGNSLDPKQYRLVGEISYDPKQYVQSHFVPDDTARDKRLLDEEWTQIRAERDRLLAESDWTQANDTPLASGKVTEWKTYRTSLRDLPSDQSSKTKYSDITWPTKP